jgi:hypothetical protein
MNKMFTLVLGLILAGTAHAQFQFYTIEKGVKTAQKGADQILINIDENLKSDKNVMLEVNVAEFKKKYTYNLFAIGLFCSSLGTERYLMRQPVVFGSELYTTKYGTDKVLRFYLFPDETTASDNKAFVFYAGNDWYNKFTYESTLDTLHFQLEGRYKTGSEFYSENGSVKERDLFTEAEQLKIASSPFVRFEPTEKLKQDHQRKMDEDRYKKTISDYGYSSTYQRGSEYYLTLLGIEGKLGEESDRIVTTYNIGGVGGVILYPQIAKAIEEIGDYKSALIKAEPDMYKALEMMDAWSVDYKKLFITDSLTEDQRKALNKQLKAAPDAAAKYQIFLTFQ